MDNTTNLEELKSLISNFCNDRDWSQFHNIKDLSLALQVEASELLEIFRWVKCDDSNELLKDPKKRREIENEMADILNFLLLISNYAGIDLTTAMKNKLEESAKKYPIHLAKWSSKKYTELR